MELFVEYPLPNIGELKDAIFAYSSLQTVWKPRIGMRFMQHRAVSTGNPVRKRREKQAAQGWERGASLGDQHWAQREKHTQAEGCCSRVQTGEVNKSVVEASHIEAA